MILKFLGKGVRQPSEATHVHADRQVAAFDIAGTDMCRIRTALNAARFGADASPWL